MLTNLIWGLGAQKGCGAYPSAQILNCPCLRLFWKTPSEIPRHRHLWKKFLSCSGSGRYCTPEAMPPCAAAESRKQGQRWVDLNVFKAWKPAAAPSGASGASNHGHGLASWTSREEDNSLRGRWVRSAQRRGTLSLHSSAMRTSRNVETSSENLS